MIQGERNGMLGGVLVEDSIGTCLRNSYFAVGTGVAQLGVQSYIRIGLEFRVPGSRGLRSGRVFRV